MEYSFFLNFILLSFFNFTIFFCFFKAQNKTTIRSQKVSTDISQPRDFRCIARSPHRGPQAVIRRDYTPSSKTKQLNLEKKNTTKVKSEGVTPLRHSITDIFSLFLVSAKPPCSNKQVVYLLNQFEKWLPMHQCP